MGSARLIAAVTFLIVARGQARPMDMPPDLQGGSHTEETTNDTAPSAEPESEEPAGTYSQDVADTLKPETSKASMDNEQTLLSEGFTGGNSEITVTPHIPITNEPLIGRTNFDGEIPSNDSVSVPKQEDVPEEKSEDKSKSTVSDNNETLYSFQHSPSAATTSPFPDQNISFSSEETDTNSAEQPLNPSISTKLQTTEHHTFSTPPMQEHTSEHKLDEDSKIQHSFTVDNEPHTDDVTKSVNETDTTHAVPATTHAITAATQPTSTTIQATPLNLHDGQPTSTTTLPTSATIQANATTQTTPHNLHDGHALYTTTLSTTERPSSVQTSNSADISERFGHHHSPHEEESPSKNIEIEAEGAEGSSNKGQMTSSSDWFFTAVTVAVAMDGIVKAFSSSSPTFKDTATSTMPLSTSSLSEEQLSASSFVDPSIPKSRSSPVSSLPPLSLSSAELPDSFVDTKILKDQSNSPTSTSTKMPVTSFVDTRITQDSSFSTTSIIFPSSQVTANTSDSFMDTKAPEESLSSTTWSQASTKLPASSFADTGSLTSSLTSSSSDSSQGSTEVSDSSLGDIRISKDSSSSMTSSGSTSSQESAEKPGSPIVGSSILTDTSSSIVSTSTLIQVPELPASSFVDARISTPSSALPSFPTSAQLPASSIEDIKISNDLTFSIPSSASPLPPVSADLPTSSSVDTRTLKNPSSLPLSPSSAELPDRSFGNTLAAKTIPSQPLKEVTVSSVAETKILKYSPSSPTLSLPEELSVSTLEHAKVSKDSTSPLAASQVPAEVPLSSFPNGPNSNAPEYVITSSYEKLLAMSEEEDAPNLLKFADMEDDMDVAETMVFRPVFSYRQDNARRRFLRSLGDQRNYL